MEYSLGSKLDTQQISDIIAVIDADTFERPFYAGNAIATVKSSDAKNCDFSSHRSFRYEKSWKPLHKFFRYWKSKKEKKNRKSKKKKMPKNIMYFSY